MLVMTSNIFFSICLMLIAVSLLCACGVFLEFWIVLNFSVPFRCSWCCLFRFFIILNFKVSLGVVFAVSFV